MCLFVFAWKAHPNYPLIVAANRDEFYDRPTAPAHWWQPEAKVLGGRDLQAGGSWMAMSKLGRFAAVTNYRDPANIRPDAKSRGALPVDFVIGKEAPEAFMQGIEPHSTYYNGFNMLACDLRQMAYFSNYENKIRPLRPGIYGLSNALLDTPWPKVQRARQKFAELVQKPFEITDLLEIMTDNHLFSDNELPSTGVSLEWERQLSAICIRTPHYGTCSTTAMTVDLSGNVQFAERSYPVGQRKDEAHTFNFRVE